MSTPFFNKICNTNDKANKGSCDSIHSFMKMCLKKEQKNGKSEPSILKDIAFEYSLIDIRNRHPLSANNGKRERKFKLVDTIIDRDGIQTLNELETVLDFNQFDYDEKIYGGMMGKIKSWIGWNQ